MEQYFFNVKRAVKLNGKLCIPAVSYKLPGSWCSTAEDLEKAGKLHITDHVVVFQNGRPVDPSDREKETACFSQSKSGV